MGFLALAPNGVVTDELALGFQAGQRRTYALIAVLALLLSALAALLLARRLLRPIRRITAAAKALGAGRYTTRIQADRNDELGRLAWDFNHLAAALQRNEQTRRLQQLFTNLLENSQRYTDPGGRLEITLDSATGEAADDCYHLLLQDTAPGVPAQALPRLLERLYRVDKSRSRNLGGAGLGLAICRNIVAAHGGQIEAAHSSLGGLALRIRLPAGERRSG